ncbi:ABC transporter permease [Diplocloster modestus]|uniref:FtsX-like permease family protein n=1 Tax=Diplocloster modestus TaxID=2850322 RepID=A0ABS6K2V5_9FIRM|nr:FtsX-like permease family protein [Diplocloster modestus]MBU9724833.1 FtsX-like permease family protein [Diplocloster modestus]
MNIFNKVALQGLKKNRTRTIVTIIGVILSAAMITAVATFGVSLLDYMTKGAAKKYGGWQAAFLDVDSSFVQEQQLNKEVKDTVTFENIGYAALDSGSDPDKPYLFIAGYHPETFDALPIPLLSGRLPENSGEILVSGKVASNGGVSYAVGDTISLAVGSRMKGDEKLGQSDPYTAGDETLLPEAKRTYRIVGICQTPVFEKDSSPGYTLITRTDTADTADNLSLFVTLKNPRQVLSYVDTAADGHSYILNNDVLRFMGLSDDPSDQIFNGLLYTVGGIVIAIIMIGSIFLIYNSFSISLNERTRQIGILSSVGATAKQLRNSVLFEGLCIGAVGIPIGVLVGIGSIGLVIIVVAKNFGTLLYADVPLTLHVSALAIAGAAAVSIVTILISAYIPAKKAAGTPVMECIRQTNEVKMESKSVKTSKLSQRIYGLEGILALKNFKRNRKRYRSIVLSLVLSIVLFISTSAFVMDLKKASDQTKMVTSYDIGFGTQEMDDGEMLQLYDKLKNADGVYESSYQAYMEYSCIVPADGLSEDYWESAGGRSPDEISPDESPDAMSADGTVHLSMGIQFLDDSAYLGILESLGLPEEEYTGQSGKIIAVAKMQSNSSQVEKVEQLRALFTDPSMDFTIFPQTNNGSETEIGQNVNLTFVDIVPPDTPPIAGTVEQTPYFFQALAPWSLKDKLAPSDSPADVRVKGLTFQSENPSKSTAEMKTVIQGAGITSAYILLNTSEMLEESRNYVFIANVFAYTFIIMISLIAVANVFNTISTNIKLRRQELAMLRSVGMSDRDFNKMMRFECVFYGMRALLIGLPLAVVSSLLIHRGMFIAGADSIAFALPWASIGISVCSVLLVIFVTMMYAVGKIKKENIIDALRDDMT